MARQTAGNERYTDCAVNTAREREREEEGRQREIAGSLQIASQIKHRLYIKRNLLRRPADCLSTVQALGSSCIRDGGLRRPSAARFFRPPASCGLRRCLRARSRRVINVSERVSAPEMNIPDQYFRDPTSQLLPFDVPTCDAGAQTRARALPGIR